MSLYFCYPIGYNDLVPGRGCIRLPMCIDFHTHILPGIDDGSRDEAMTEALLREEAAQGVTLVTATPHFYPNRISVDRFLSRREAALESTEAIRRKADGSLPEIVCGAEVYYFQGIGKAKDIRRTAVGEQTLLLEMPFEQWTESMVRDVKDLQEQGLTVVLAHIERYPEFQRKKECWEKLMESGVIKQLNAGSFLKKSGPGGSGLLSGFVRGKKRIQFCLDFLRDHEETIIGTDCHNLEGRRPKLREAREVIRDALGAERLERIDRLTEMLAGAGRGKEKNGHG